MDVLFTPPPPPPPPCLQLEDLCCGESLDLTQHDEGERMFIQAILKQLGLVSPVEGRPSCLPPQMEAVHLLVSALEGERKQWE